MDEDSLDEEPRVWKFPELKLWIGRGYPRPPHRVRDPPGSAASLRIEDWGSRGLRGHVTGAKGPRIGGSYLGLRTFDSHSGNWAPPGAVLAPLGPSWIHIGSILGIAIARTSIPRAFFAFVRVCFVR